MDIVFAMILSIAIKGISAVVEIFIQMLITNDNFTAVAISKTICTKHCWCLEQQCFIISRFVP